MMDWLLMALAFALGAYVGAITTRRKIYREFEQLDREWHQWRIDEGRG